MLPTIRNLWVPTGTEDSLHFLELLVSNRYEIMVWLPSGYAQKVEVK